MNWSIKTVFINTLIQFLPSYTVLVQYVKYKSILCYSEGLLKDCFFFRFVSYKRKENFYVRLKIKICIISNVNNVVYFLKNRTSIFSQFKRINYLYKGY